MQVDVQPKVQPASENGYVCARSQSTLNMRCQRGCLCNRETSTSRDVEAAIKWGAVIPIDWESGERAR
eukprot:1914580-Pleurochrysis_carterae.AAC.1